MKTSWQDVLKTSWKRLEDVLARRYEDVLKTSWRRLEEIWRRRVYWSWPRRFEDVFWRRKTKANIFVLMKTSWRRLHQDECLLGTDINQQRCFLWSLAKFLIEQVCVTAFNRTALFYRTALRDCFCNFKVVKVRFLIYCTLLTKLHYFSYILPKSINLVSLERYYQVEHHFILFL